MLAILSHCYIDTPDPVLGILSHYIDNPVPVLGILSHYKVTLVPVFRILSHNEDTQMGVVGDGSRSRYLLLGFIP